MNMAQETKGHAPRQQMVHDYKFSKIQVVEKPPVINRKIRLLTSQ